MKNIREPLGNLFQISNQVTLGITEQEIIENITKVIQQLLMYERNQRQHLLTHNSKEIEDKNWRAYGCLTHARIISSKETIGLLSLLRMGVDLGILDPDLRKKINELMISTQPANLQKILDSQLVSKERDFERASLIRKMLTKKIPTSKE